MPSNQEHAGRVLRGLGWLKNNAPHYKTCREQLINEYFYVAMHMLECVCFDFTEYVTCPDYYDHEARNKVLADLNPISPLYKMTAPYMSLYYLSRRARYLQQKKNTRPDPVKDNDVVMAQKSFEAVRLILETVYTKATKPIPWIVVPAIAAGAAPTAPAGAAPTAPAGAPPAGAAPAPAGAGTTKPK